MPFSVRTYNGPIIQIDCLRNLCYSTKRICVYSDHGPYIFVVYTDLPFGVFKDYTTPNPLYGLMERIYEVQCSLT